MEQQSGNNLDALFQKAAEDYPLKTDNNNWAVVAAKLRNAAISSPAKSRMWKYAAMLLVLFSAGGFLYFHNKAVDDTDRLADYQSKIVSTKTIKQLPDDKEFKETSAAKTLQDQSNKNISNNRFIKLSDNNLNSSSTSNTKLYEQKNITANNKFESAKIAGVIKNLVSVQSEKSVSNTSTPQIFSGSVNNNTETKTDNVINNKNINQPSNEKAQNNETQNKSTESQQIKLAQQQKLLYGEIFFAPDFSTVKLQNVNAPGYNVGVAIGYKISKRFSAELGLERLHTDFYSNAKYLDKSHLKLKPNTTVQFVNGKSKLTEVPFDIKYNLSKKNEHFFVTIGTTVARITHTEKYNYRVIKDGTQHEASKHFGALTGTEFFSDINLSAGYQTKLSSSFSLKAAPYYQVPLKGLGVGNLPVTNFGVSIGIIKDLK